MANVHRINVLGGLSVTSERHPAGTLTQPRRLAVLAILAVAGERGVTREEILTLLWPDNDEERGRHALTQALYALRKDLDAEELVLGQQELRLNPDLVTSDWAEFHQALRGGQAERAIELYGGAFLERFQLPRIDNFEHWAERQRSRVEQELGQALESAAHKASAVQDTAAAVSFLRRRSAQDPLNPKVAVKLMEALAAHGDVVEALQHARAYEARVRQELDLPVDPSVTSLANRLRATSRQAVNEDQGLRADARPGTTDAEGLSSRARRGIPDLASEGQARSRWRAATAVTLLVMAGLLAAFYLRPSRGTLADAARPVLAVGVITDYGTKGGTTLGSAVGDMLATNLSRGSGYRVISSGRMLELVRQVRGSGDSTDAEVRAARRAGAAQLIDGALYTLAPTRYRLDLRRVDLSTGAVIQAYKVEGSDLFALVDSGTVLVAPDLGGAPPSGSVSEVSTHSIAAYQRYLEGLRHYYDGDLILAERDFQDALQLDSMFVMAAFYYGRSFNAGPENTRFERLRRAMALSHLASDRERLVIQAEWAMMNRSPALMAIADTLRIRYPEEVDGDAYRAQAALLLGQYPVAESAFRRLLAFDSMGVRTSVPGRCLSCEAYVGLSYVYGALDSQRLLAVSIREWLRRQPGNAAAWRAISNVYTTERQLDAALKAIRIADSLEPGSPLNRAQFIGTIVNFERYDQAEQLVRGEMAAGTYSQRPRAQWGLAVNLRQVGRLDEALALAHDHRLLAHEELLPGAAPYDALLEGQILFEQGKYRAAAALFDSVAIGSRMPIDSSLRYGAKIWAWTHSADCYDMLGDTAQLRFLADTIETLGRKVAMARDQRLHAYVRGLIARREGRDEDAIRWFQRALSSPTIGFTRVNYALADLYLKKGRSTEAVNLLRAAYRGGMVGSNLYVTRTDIELRLARAFEAANQSDSALVYYQRVAAAWKGADAMFRPRQDSVAAALQRLGA